MKEMVGGCCICSDEQGWDENPLVYCDGPTCNVAVHQACYGIVTVPSGPWFCRKCESQERSAKLQCDLCPSKEGAFKRTDKNGWAHVVCALYIPEVRFGNVTTMEPIEVSHIPPERFNKTCFICDENNRENKKHLGAFMQCNKPGCKQHFHVTCAQFLGLLCEEAGHMQDNVKYCGYCQHHYSKLKKTSNLKIVPPYKPAPNPGGTDSPTSSPEKGNPKLSNDLQGSSDGQTPATSGNGANSTVVSTSNVISPDVSNGNRNTGGRGSANKKNLGNSKTGNPNNGNSSGNSASPSPIPRIQPGNLFSSGAFSSSLNSKTPSSSPVDESSLGKLEKWKVKGPSSVKSNNEDDSNTNGSAEGGCVIVKPDSKPSVLPAPFVIKNKDFASVSMNDVVSDVLDRPMSSTTSKFGRGGSSGSVIESGMKSSGSGSSSRCDKPAPDIKPHVTLTPIPMRSDDAMNKNDKSLAGAGTLNFSSSFAQSTTKLRLSPEEVNRDLKSLSMGLDDGMATLEKTSPAGKRSRHPAETYDSDTESATEEWPEREESQSNSQTQFRSHFSRIETYQMTQQPHNQHPTHHSRNPNRMLTSAQANEMSHWEANSGKMATVPIERIRMTEGETGQSFGSSEFPHKRGPGRPAKQRSGASRDEEPRERKTPAKRGRRGSNSANNFSRRDGRDSSASNTNTNGVPMDDTPYDDPVDSPNNPSSSRGGRHAGSGRKQGPTSTNTKKPNYDDSSTPTMSQLKAQMANAAAATTSDKTSLLPSHMFGNIINPESSLAKNLVEEINMANQGGVSEVLTPPTSIVGIPFPGKSTIHKTNAGSGTNGVPPKSGSSNQPQTLEELLERQWEQGSQFLMEQAQHLDIAQLLSCLNQLKQDNKALEDHVASLCQRKEQLTAINARLSIPLGSSTSLSLVGPGFSNNAGNQGNSTLSIQQGSKNSTAPPPTPHQQLQHQIQQETVLQQGRLITHTFPPGNSMPGHSHGQGHHGGHGHGHSSHGHRNSGGNSGQGQGQVYGYPGHGSGSSGQVGTSHPSPHLTNNSHNSNNTHHSHSSHPPRDSR